MCPWSSFTPQPYNFCEAQLCGWVNQPANTFSNIGYLIVSIWIWKYPTTQRRLRQFFAFSLLALCIGSTIFHGTATVIGKMMDVSAMFIISMGILTVAIQHYFVWPEKKLFVFYGIGLFFSLVFLFTLKFGNVLFLTEIFIAALFEYLAQRDGKNPIDKKQFYYSLLTLAAAMGIWWLDMKKILCWPDQHYFSGHGAWHILTAVSMGLLFKAYVTGSSTKLNFK